MKNFTQGQSKSSEKRWEIDEKNSQGDYTGELIRIYYLKADDTRLRKIRTFYGLDIHQFHIIIFQSEL